MRKEYDFSEQAVRGKYAARIRSEGMTVTEHRTDGRSVAWYYPPEMLPNAAKRIHVYFSSPDWLVRVEGSSKAHRRVKTEVEAVDIAVKMANRTKALLIVHPITNSRTKSGRKHAQAS